MYLQYKYQIVLLFLYDACCHAALQRLVVPMRAARSYRIYVYSSLLKILSLQSSKFFARFFSLSLCMYSCCTLWLLGVGGALNRQLECAVRSVQQSPPHPAAAAADPECALINPATLMAKKITRGRRPSLIYFSSCTACARVFRSAICCVT